MRSQQSFLGALLCLGYGAGCVEDLGTCDPAKLGRDSVLMNSSNVVVYAGQAIIDKACATGCHASTAKGKDRRGAPEGLDFDLLPVLEAKAAGTKKNAKGDTIVKLKSSQASALQHRRNVVMSQREEIWRQVQENLMPPTSFEALLTSIYTAKDSDPCTRVSPFKKLPDGLARQAFRNWLACGVPIVEAVGEDVSKPQAVGSVGYQFPLCAPPDTSSEPSTLESLLDGPFASCGSCHPILSPPDFRSIDTLKTSLLGSTTPACNDKPFVTAGDPGASFLYDVLALEDPGCGHTQMPAGGPYLSATELKQVSDWITAGAPATAADLADSSSEPSADPSASP